MTRQQGRGANQKGSGRQPGADLRTLLLERMDACPTAEVLNDQVILPFVAALEDVCRARGYVMNIYGEQSNLVFSGDEDAAAEIYALAEAVLEALPVAVAIDDPNS